ncbi:hypothetical protein D3C71_1323810 [compost metagenome]
MAETAQACQQPAHGQGRGCFHAEDVVFTAQGLAGPLQGAEAFTYSGQQKPRRFGQLQATPTAHEQTPTKVILKGADMPADRALGDRQLFTRTGEGTQPGGGLECAQRIQRG